MHQRLRKGCERAVMDSIVKGVGRLTHGLTSLIHGLCGFSIGQFFKHGLGLVHGLFLGFQNDIEILAVLI